MNIKTRIPNEIRTAQTRAALLAAARTLFIEQGFAETGTPELVKAAGVTRGALYHHFDDKKAVLRAVIEKESAEVAAAIRRSTETPLSAIAALKQGAAAYLDAMQSPGRVKLLLIEGPANLGAAEMQAINDASAGQTLVEGLQIAMDSGEIASRSTAALASLLDAAFDRAALEIANGASRSDFATAIDAILDGLACRSREAQ